MRAVAPASINAFFTNLKDMWLERAPNLNGGQNYQNNSSAEIDKLNAKITTLQAQLSQPAQVYPQNNEASADFEKLNSKIASLEAQLAESIQVHSRLAQCLHLSENVINSNNAPIYDKYINEELERRLGVIETHLAELLRKDTVDTNSTLNDHSNGGLEKRLGQIEAHLTKLAKKDTRDAKTFQRQCSESSPFGGFEKRLGQIEALLAKLARGSKSKIKYAEQSKYPNKSSSGVSGETISSKISNQTKPQQDNNLPSTCNVSSEKGSQGTRRVSLEETIRKIIQSEFVNYLPYIIQQAKKCEPVSAQDSDEEDILDGPMEIDFVQKKEPPTSIATVKCKIKRLKIPAMALDSCAELPIVTPDIVERVGNTDAQLIGTKMS
ncbi:unnamed protein product [Rhizophagus irregularis]|nr:unnamed protein product [Rhizophagus irregularis]